MKRIIEAKVRGRVQGVGFRKATARKGEEHGACGWVRNENDGRVTCVVQGSEKTIEAMTSFLRKGPLLARVEEVLINELDSFPSVPVDAIQFGDEK